MNRHLTLLTAVVMTILCVSCNKDDTKSDPFITITTPAGKNPTSITIEATAYSQDFTISSNASWRIDKPATANWLTVSPLEGTGDATIKVSAAANEQTSRLQAMLTFYSGDTKLHTAVCLPRHFFEFFQIEEKEEVIAQDLLDNAQECVAFNSSHPLLSDVPAYGGKILRIRL